MAVLWLIGTVFIAYDGLANPTYRYRLYYLKFGESQILSDYMFSSTYDDLREKKNAGSYVEISVKDYEELTVFFPIINSKPEQMAPFMGKIIADQNKVRVGEWWTNLAAYIAGGVLPPVVLLIFGMTIGWVLVGFRRVQA